MGFAAIFSFSSSASCSRLALALLFWNQIFTWVSVKFKELENSARSAMERYCFWRNFLSKASSWDVVKGVRGFRFVLCLRRGHAGGLSLPVKCHQKALNKITSRASKGKFKLSNAIYVEIPASVDKLTWRS